MRKNLVVFLFLAFVTFSVTGCGSSSSSSTSTIPASATAASIGSSAYNSITIDDTILGLPDVTVEASSLRANSPSTPVYGADGWWTSSNSASAGGISYGYYYKFKIWDNSDTEVTSLPASSINKIYAYCTFEVTSASATTSFLLSFGESTSSPLIFDEINGASPTISGTLSYSSTYDGDTYVSSITYSSVSMSASGYPDGEVDFSVSFGGSTALSGTITYDGTATATITFSTASGGGTYTVDLETGAVS